MIFGIPLRCRDSARDWDKVVSDFNHTLRSVLNQTNPDIRVLVACNDRPDAFYDSRVEYIELPQMYKGPDDAMYDKGNKLMAIGIRARALGGGPIMLVDADDFVSNRIAAHVKGTTQSDGIFAQNGYELDIQKQRVIPSPFFVRNCGTCAAIRYAPDELPSAMDQPEEDFVIRAGHHNWLPELKRLGKKTSNFPFPAALHRLNTGENHSLSTGNVGTKRKILRKVIPSRPITDALREEFSIPLTD